MANVRMDFGRQFLTFYSGNFFHFFSGLFPELTTTAYSQQLQSKVSGARFGLKEPDLVSRNQIWSPVTLTGE